MTCRQKTGLQRTSPREIWPLWGMFHYDAYKLILFYSDCHQPLFFSNKKALKPPFHGLCNVSTYGGQGGIRTLGTLIHVHTLSRRAPSTSSDTCPYCLNDNKLSKTQNVLYKFPARLSTLFYIFTEICKTGFLFCVTIKQTL